MMQADHRSFKSLVVLTHVLLCRSFLITSRKHPVIPLLPEKTTSQVQRLQSSIPHRTLARGQQSGWDESSNPAAELTNALARLDRQWSLQQRNKPRSRWTKLILESEGSNDIQEEPGAYFDSAPFAEVSVPASVPPEEDYVFLCEPPNRTIPSCLIVFVGGAGLGAFPHVAYQEFLQRTSDRLNAAVITAPYQVGLDHFGLAKQVGELLRRAVLQCEEDPERMYPSQIPTYCLSHSLGGKLATIYMAATGQDFEGIGLISFNNFSFGRTVGMARDFAQELQQNMRGDSRGPTTTPPGNEMFQGLFSMAEGFLNNMGIDFSPSAEDTERLITLKYNRERSVKTRLFVFEDDNLDSSKSFMDACGQGLDNDYLPKVSVLPGTHLTPVFFQIGIDDLPQEAQEISRENLGGFESASFGNEEHLNALVDEVCNFVLGKPAAQQRTIPYLTGSGAKDER